MAKKSKTPMFIWVLGWLIIFPIPLTILVSRTNSFSKKSKNVIIASAWVVFSLIAIPAIFSDSQSTKNKLPAVDSSVSDHSSAPETTETTTTAVTPTETPTNTTTVETTDGHRYYVLNPNSGKIHTPDCYTLDEHSGDYEDIMDITEEWVEANGYTLCQKCYPYVPSEKE